MELLNGLHWLWMQMTFQVDWMDNVFWFVTLLTGMLLIVEVVWPWRAQQSFRRKDWVLDLVYLYLNLFIFSIALDVVYRWLGRWVPMNWNILDLRTLPVFVQLSIFFVLQDFLQWWVHRLLHANQWLWRFHQIHHSVEQMGVASHFRYHWMENVLYKPTTLATLSIFAGVEPTFAVIVHALTLVIGHLNHSNIRIGWGPLRYVLNSPTMHLLHHSRSHLRQGGVNFGLSLSCWDYIFGTAVNPTQDGELELGFDGVEAVPSELLPQFVHGFRASQSK